jgi:hypothetical protein
MHFNIYFLKLHIQWVTSHFAVHKTNFKILRHICYILFKLCDGHNISLSTSSASTQSNETPNVHKATYQTQNSAYHSVIFCQGGSTYDMFSTLLSHPLLSLSLFSFVWHPSMGPTLSQYDPFEDRIQVQQISILL